MKALIAVAAVALLAGCASHQCVQPDPVQPAHGTWNKGVNAGQEIVPFNSTQHAK